MTGSSSTATTEGAPVSTPLAGGPWALTLGTYRREEPSSVPRLIHRRRLERRGALGFHHTTVDLSSAIEG